MRKYEQTGSRSPNYILLLCLHLHNMRCLFGSCVDERVFRAEGLVRGIWVGVVGRGG